MAVGKMWKKAEHSYYQIAFELRKITYKLVFYYYYPAVFFAVVYGLKKEMFQVISPMDKGPAGIIFIAT